ncbi:MAG: hypothetical protein OMM_04602 [Candidatus Magnetoglobus multicellularis str. Araruama]|uniref:Uncharacterized protein n=1 Tax=Candidatus Magnetoglobus multicellularis str. Araruama TaxID=890399 RepID=A0A1V1P0N4_9BACT|nr:MAG: hypothetical protein OMM_04602 [Candidatus Magnetoglobus multicellularis str. Araruama]
MNTDNNNKLKDIQKAQNAIVSKEYELSDNTTIIDNRTVNILIKNTKDSERIKAIKELLEIDLEYKKQLSKIKNKEVSENPIFQMDSKNEKHKRLLTFLLWISGVISIIGVFFGNPISCIFLGFISILSFLSVSLNTKLTTADRRVIFGILSKMTEVFKLTSEKEKSNE